MLCCMIRPIRARSIDMIGIFQVERSVYQEQGRMVEKRRMIFEVTQG